MASKQDISFFQVSGEPYDIGYQLGAIARPVFADYMAQSAAWQAVRRWRGDPFVQTLRDAARAHFPALLAELDGMAAGLGWAAEDVFLWNCRGELIHNAPDGCTTLAAIEGGTRFIAHNEDGDPFLRERCAMVEVQAKGQPGFVSFYYPGSLPGHTFAANRAGIAQAINNLRIRTPAAGVPRMILARAVLDAGSLGEALHILRGVPSASGFHHTLGSAGDARLFSVEASARRCSVQEVSKLSGHANHMIHPGCEAEAQIVTESSRDRQSRVNALLPALAGATQLQPAALLEVLQDRAPAGLPIYRDDPHDPDDENTLATALFDIGSTGVSMKVYRHGQCAFERSIVSAAHEARVSEHAAITRN
ncbi:C45 family autoproteolytic acyltransferase/hydolase [Paraburkholderia susongensis]|uniref:Acyl-coenzyme A:6-aminopenicillanic acid acyl-transferase n=1 Tax=Paraburkholderia susongensis TaxID=1515439 RepID=A0A1X7LRT8_9BURK|nr:C45 family peptidase [Paraburkholderia susongensis]SMG56043.1 Acyl-coenzyme A:6-aminopenicillanic acid acyl-transferase [Paraburkholderia susongensis]